MKKFILLLTVASATLIGCSKSEDTPIETSASMTVKFDDVFENTIYPSLIHNLAQLKTTDGSKAEYFEVEVNSATKFDAVIKITNSKFIEETTIRKTFEAGNNKFTLSPKWKYDELIKITTPGSTHFSFEIIDEKTSKVLDNEDLQLSYRSINECVFLVEEDGEIVDLRALFTAYVNEDSPLIDSFLKEVGDAWRVAAQANLVLPFYGWSGEQSGDNYAALQIAMIIGYLGGQNFTYSSIVNTSNSSQKVFSQYVRFIDNTIKNKQANCVDGSVLLASIFKKIGLNSFLVIEPGHMYMGVELASGKYIYVETTVIGSTLSPFMENLKNPNNSVIIHINEARALGIKPIQ